MPREDKRLMTIKRFSDAFFHNAFTRSGTDAHNAIRGQNYPLWLEQLSCIIVLVPTFPQCCKFQTTQTQL
uniref:Uncharacterized protein n=1 Tax=Anguilla anguilla TaxID=7936 RepID=A0A0E9R0L9_ANGAN